MGSLVKSVKKQESKSKNRDELYFSIPLPLDSQGFVQSFDINNFDQNQVKQFYHDFGIVVFKNVINQEEINKTIDDLWTQVENVYGNDVRVYDRKDPKTWNFSGMLNAAGFINNAPIDQVQIWKNRANANVYKCFKRLYQISSKKPLTQPLISCFDRASMLRPTKNNPQWQTSDIYHFDIDPWYWVGLAEDTVYYKFKDQCKMYYSYSRLLGQGNYDPYNGFTKLAGVLVLSDTNQMSGGFEAACGFHNYIKKWCQSKPYGTPITDDQDLLKNFQKIFARKGSLIVFSRQLPHNIYQNKSQNFRYAQYLRLTPQSTLYLSQEMKQNRRQLIHPQIPKQLQRNKIFKQIFMIQEEKEQQINAVQ